ncbi:hypothetical protein BDC45DRAFT_562528 [Circinella umbellata]|nr:hypothetical protein BDC45DRAFT_562528 [Circinella umbellata]
MNFAETCLAFGHLACLTSGSGKYVVPQINSGATCERRAFCISVTKLIVRMGDMFKTIASKPFIAPYLWMICTRPHLLLDVKDIQLPATEILKITEKLESYM